MELKQVRKIGVKTIPLLNKLNIYNTNDLLEYYPYRYNIYKPSNINDNPIDAIITINVTVESTPKISYIRKNFNSLNFKALVNNLLINVSIFNRSFLYNKLDVGKNISLIGKYDKYKNKFIASDLRLSWINEVKIEPIYHIVKGLKNANLNYFINMVLSDCKNCIDYIPNNLKNEYKFIDKKKALEIIHNPKNINDLKQAKLRLIYEEFFIFMLKMNYLKTKNERIKGLKKEFDKTQVNEFINSLSFSLTTDQLNAVNDILTDLKSAKKMNRLVLGDVGSGKTIVAIIAMYANHLSNYQSALMAPTEILATQHYENMKNLFAKFNVNVALLVGSLKKSERNQIVEDLKLGKIDIVIGTHALISEDVKFNNLGLVITDEQHRFGVNQRVNLQNKGKYPDVIYMSATPIPRTYALTIYQDMDTSIIKTKPNGRKEIKTFVKKESEIKSVLQNVYEEIKKGRQVYVVAPSIEENENKNDVENLKKNFDTAFNGKVKIEIIHGKIKQVEKDKIMKDFENNIIKILIATTVVEVGVDVKNATMMIIYNAENFGLATLHQLRGRVGRNEYDSYCYLISNSDIDRLKVLESSNDGFYISEQDFLNRREGDLFGTRQSGDMVFKLGNLKNDFKILLQAKKDSENLLKNDIIEDKYLKILNCVDIVD